MGRIRTLALLLVALSVLSLLLAGWLVLERRAHDRANVRDAQALARVEAKDAAKAIDKLLITVEESGNKLLSQLNSGKVNSSNAGKATKALLAAHPSLWGVGITYDRRLPSAPADPNHYDTRPGGVIQPGEITYDYEDPAEPKGHWWRRAMAGGTTWVPPYLGGTTKRMVAVYTGRFYGPEAPPGGGPAGAIIISIQLDTINRSFGWSELGGSGYGFIVSRSGSYPEHPSGNKNGGFVTHPHKSYWRGAEAPSFAEVAKKNGNEAAIAVIERTSARDAAPVEYQDELTGQPAWLFTADIPTADWVLGFVAIKKVVLAGDRTSYHYNIAILCLVFVGIACLLIVLALVGLRGNWRIWLITFIITAVPCAGTGAIWVLNRSLVEVPAGVAEQTANPQGFAVDRGLGQLSQQVDKYFSYVASVAPDLEPHAVLAGIFVQTVARGQSIHGWRMSGTVWQRYANGVPEGEVPGFVFPDAIEPPQFARAYEIEDGDTRTIGWRFTVVLEPERKLDTYPFDGMDVRLRLSHRDIVRPIVLVPDLAEYDLIVPIAHPGLSPQIQTAQFQITASSFGYSLDTTNSTFGIPNFSRQTEFPELVFTVHLNRKFLDPFVSQLMVLIVIALLLFAVHLMATRASEFALFISPRKVPPGMRLRLWDSEHPAAHHPAQEEVPGRSTGNFYVQAALSSVLALMFVTLLSHNNLRNTLDAEEIVYPDYAYFVLYVALLFVAVNSLLFATGNGGRFIHWRKNLLPQLVYWPSMATVLFVATLVVFY